LVRDRWNSRLNEYSLIDHAPPAAITNKSAQEFISGLNEEMEENRRSHPSAEDAAEQRASEDEELKEQKILAMVQENSRAKKQSGQRTSSTSESRSSNVNQRTQSGLNRASSRDDRQRKEAAEHRR